MEANLPLLDELGGTRTYNHYPNGWAMAFNTPFKMWKRYEFNGGTSDPCIISWPAGMQARGELREQYHHAIDLVPTILDVLGVEPPAAIKGHVQSHFDGVSMRYSLDDAAAPTATAHAVLLDARLPRRSGTTAGRPSRTTRRSAAGATSTTTSGSCTTPTSTGPSCTTWPAEHPEKVRELVNLWFAEAGANGAFPLDDRSAARDHDHPSPGAVAAAQPLRLLPRHRRDPGVAGGQRPQPLLRDRRARRPTRPRGRRACSSPTARPSAATPCTSRTTDCTTSYNFVGMSEQQRGRRPWTCPPART